jgi:hypothetical protein
MFCTITGRSLFRLVVAAGLACSAATAAADVVCVPNDAIDGSCTPAMGAATINAGVVLAAPGDTVLVDDGTYVESVLLNKNVVLLSRNGRAATTIQPPASPAAALGTVLVTSNTTALQIGGTGQGFTIAGLDNVSPGLESAALYFQGSHSNAQIVDNEISAAGDHGLLTEFGATISGFIISDNTFSGQTFVGTPAGYGFGQQFTLANVPRQLVVMGGGSGGGLTSNITFTNNEVTGTAGGINPDLTGTQCPVVAQPCEQGNNLVTIDANGATISGNTFAGTTARFAVSLRSRGPATGITGNDFDSSGLTATSGHVFVQNTGSDVAAVAAGNTFDKGVYAAGPIGTIGVSLAVAAAAAAPGTTLEVMPGTYAESVTLTKLLTLHGAQAGIDACGRVAAESIVAPLAGTALTLATGAAGSVVDGFTFAGGTRGIESSSGPLNGLQLRNNRIVGFSGNGIFLNDAGIDIDVDQNAIDGSSKVGGGGLVHLDTDSFAGFHFTDNCIANGPTATGFFVDGNHNVGVSATPRAPEFSGNEIDGCVTGANLGSRAFDGGTISDNVFSNNAFDGLQGGIQNTTISQNLFSGNGRSGLALTSFGNGAVDRGGQNDLITNNCFTGNGFAQGGEGVFLSASQAAGTISSNQLTQNNFSNNNVGARYAGGESIDAENNYWGCVTGPNTGTCDTVTNANIDADPFLIAAAAGPVECVTCTQDADCDDALACNGGETCDIGLAMCAAGTPPDCSSSADACNSGLCTEPAGACVPDPLPNGTPCGNALICSLQDACSAGACLPTSPDSDGDGVCDADERVGLSLRKVQIRDLLSRPDSDSWKVLGELDTTSSQGDFIDAVTTAGIEVIVFHDDVPLTEVTTFTFSAAQCSERRGNVRCKDAASRSKLTLAKRSAPDFFRVKIQVKKQDLGAPTVADTPLSVSLRTTEGATIIDRSDEIGAPGCAERPGSLQCRQAP